MVDQEEYKPLALAVIADAVEDMREGCPNAKRFIFSRGLELWADVLDIDADMIRKKAVEIMPPHRLRKRRLNARK